jgi:hypothetical protein
VISPIQRVSAPRAFVTYSRDHCTPADGEGVSLLGDALLQASRRVDWRFLLSSPEIGDVACIGALEATHLKALRLFSASLTEDGTLRADGKAGRRYDTVVIARPDRDLIRRAAELLKPGGFLYVEARAFTSLALIRHWKRPRGVRRTGREYLRFYRARRCVSAIERLGFVDVRVQWHWPDFESCLKIIPLNDPGALSYALGLGRCSQRNPLLRALGAWLPRSGLISRIAPCFSVIAQRGQQ